MMSGSTSFSSDVNETSRLRREVSVLQEELTQCKADKDFVWSLWKRLQVANPDITQAIGLVLQREKEKWDVREKKLMETVCHREGRIEELERRAAKQSEEISELIGSKLQLQKQDELLRCELQNTRLQCETQQREIAALQCRNADSAVRQAIRELDQLNLELKQQLAGKEAECDKLRRSLDDGDVLKDSQKRRLTNLEEDFKSLENKNVELLKENHQLQMLLKHSEDDAKSQKNGIDVKSSELESLRRELSDLWQTHRQTTEHCTQQTQLIKQLQTLHTETQTVLHNQEAAFAVELAAQQCRVHDQEQVIAELHKTLQRLKSEPNGPNTSQSDSSQVEGDEVESRIRAMEQELLTLRARVQSPRRTSFRVHETVDHALSPIHASANRGRPLRRSRSESNRERFHTSSNGDDRNVLRQKLENVEQRVEDMRETVAAKDKELEMVRTAHSRRLDRLRSVMTSYGLVKKQLQLYEDDFLYGKKKKTKKPSVSIQLVPDPRATVKQLQKEDADAVWNELAHFRKENKALKTENFKFAEDCDELRVKAASDVSALHELRCCVQEQNEEIKMLRDQLDEIGRQADADVRHQADIAQSQLDKACHEIGSLREEIHQLRLEKDELTADKRMLSEDILSLQDRNSRQRVEICTVKTDILRLQRKLRKKPMHASHSKPTASRQSAGNAQKKSVVASENQSDFWEEVFQADDVDQLTMSQVSSTSATSCSLGEAIANEARSRGATQDGVAASDSCTKLVLQQRERTSTPTSDSSSAGLNKQQRQLIKAYVMGLTKSLGVDQSAQPVAASQQCSSPAVAEGQQTATKTTTVSTSASRTIATLRQRINGLQRHLGVLRLAKEAALKSNAEQKKENDLSIEQLATTNQKLASSKQQTQRLTSEVEKLRSEKDVLETKMAEYSFDTSICSTAAKAEQELINSLQSRLKTSTTAVSRQLEQIKQLRSENEKQAEKITQQIERISHLERDLAQKRILMDDIKLKLTIAQENAESDADIMLEVEAKLKNLAENNGRLKSQIECLKTRLDCVGREKYQIELVLSKLTDEIDRKTKLVSDLQKKCCELQSRLMDVEQSAENHLRQLASHTETAIDTAQARLTTADTRLKEYAKFIKVFAFTLLTSIKQCRSALSKRRPAAGIGGGGGRDATTTVRMPSTVHTTSTSLQLSRDVTVDFSQSTLTDLLNAPTSHGDHVVHLDSVSADVSELDIRWAKRCESLLQSQAGFSLGLVDLFVEKVDERSNLSVQLNASM